MKEEFLISVIIPIYNCERYLNNCIQSVVNQSYKQIEIILVDDGSTDNSGNICDEWKLKDDRVKVYHKNNGGVSSARNMGLDKAKGAYVIFIDADDYCHKELIEKLKNSLEDNNSDLSVCAFFYDYGDRIVPSLSNDLPENMNRKVFFDNIIKPYYCGYPWNKMFRKKLIGNLRFDETKIICEDFLFLCKYIINCNNISYLKENLYYYNMNNLQSATKVKANPKFILSNYNQVLTTDEIIETIKVNNYSDIYYELEVGQILMSNYVIYHLKKNNDVIKIKKLKDLIKKYKNDGCIKKEKNLIIKFKLLFCLYFNDLYQFCKNIDNNRKRN